MTSLRQPVGVWHEIVIQARGDTSCLSMDSIFSKRTRETHYVWIKDLARMLYKNSSYKGRKYPCRRCLHVFSSEALLETHKNDCQGIGAKPQRTVMPNSHRLSQWGYYCHEVGLNILYRQLLYCTHGNTIFNTFWLRIIPTIYKIMRGVRTPSELIIYCKTCTSEYSKWLLPAAFWQL